MLLPAFRRQYGSAFRELDFRSDANVAGKEYTQKYELRRTEWTEVDSEEERCGEEKEGGLTACLTGFVERETGCRALLPDSNASLPYCKTTNQGRKLYILGNN